jgi:hypothetical protein
VRLDTDTVHDLRGSIFRQAWSPRACPRPTRGRAIGAGVKFSDAETGQPIADLQAYLSAGHVIVASQGLYTVDHGHAEASDASGAETCPLPRTSVGPDIEFHHRVPGLYKQWGSFRQSTAVSSPPTSLFTLTSRIKEQITHDLCHSQRRRHLVRAMRENDRPERVALEGFS